MLISKRISRALSWREAGVTVNRTFELYDEKYWRPLSRGARVITVAMSEGAMGSAAREWQSGRELWWVEYHGENGPSDHLDSSGAMPREFAPIRDERVALQRTARNVDHVFEVPIELANKLVGFRPDRRPLFFGPKFTELRRS